VAIILVAALLLACGPGMMSNEALIESVKTINW
jgi:hypothetical protein